MIINAGDLIRITGGWRCGKVGYVWKVIPPTVDVLLSSVEDYNAPIDWVEKLPEGDSRLDIGREVVVYHKYSKAFYEGVLQYWSTWTLEIKSHSGAYFAFTPNDVIVGVIPRTSTYTGHTCEPVTKTLFSSVYRACAICDRDM